MNEVPPSDASAPQHVRELAEMCKRLVEKATGLKLDGEPDTLPVLDHYLRGIGDDGTEVRALVSSAAGAYFGEVVRAKFPCHWHAPEQDYGDWRVEFENVFLHFNPVALAHEAITGSEVVQGGAGFGVLDEDLSKVRAGLEALGTIAEEDYFRLATRWEVLTTVVDRLAASSVAENDVPRFDHDAYRAVLDDGDDRAS